MPERPMGGEYAHPDLETLAAYADGRLDLRAREAVEAHLAECTDCYELMMEVVRSQDDLKNVRPISGRRRIWAAAGTVLAVAAALLLVVRVQPEWWQRLVGGPDSNPQLEKLVAAVGPDRTIEARLSGGFPYGPLRSPVRSGGSTGSEDLSLLAAAIGLQEAAEQDPSADNLHAAGVAHALLGRYDEAIRALEQASAVDASNARILSDLAAAHIARASAVDRAEDWPRALAAAERAIQRDEALLEAWFNRALALEKSGQNTQAIDAWREVIARDRSPWRAEAERHLAALTSPPTGASRD